MVAGRQEIRSLFDIYFKRDAQKYFKFSCSTGYYVHYYLRVLAWVCFSCVFLIFIIWAVVSSTICFHLKFF